MTLLVPTPILILYHLVQDISMIAYSLIYSGQTGFKHPVMLVFSMKL